MNKLFLWSLCFLTATTINPINLCIVNNDPVNVQCGILDSIITCDGTQSRLAPGGQTTIAVENEQQFTIFRPFTNVCASGAYYPFQVNVLVDSSLPETSKDFTCAIRDLASHSQEKRYTIKLDERTRLLIERGEPMNLEKKHEFAFKSLRSHDLPLLFDWFLEPYIAQVWVEPKNWEAFQEKWKPKLANSDVHAFIAYVDNQPIGYIQHYHVTDEDRAYFPGVTIPEHSIGIDLFIGNPEFLDKGYGTRMIKEFIAFAQKREPKAQNIIIDPATDNYRAIACYKKVGFAEMGEFMVPYGPTDNGQSLVLLMMYTNR